MKGSSVLSVKEQCHDYCSFLFSQTVEDIYLDKITSSGWCGVKVPGLTCLSLRKFQQKRGKGLDLPQRSTCSVRVFPCLCVDVGSLWIGELSTPHWVVTASGLRSSFRSWLPRSSQAVTLVTCECWLDRLWGRVVGKFKLASCKVFILSFLWAENIVKVAFIQCFLHRTYKMWRLRNRRGKQ